MAKESRCEMADRGVSETIGFVLIFALIVTTLGIVYTTGMAGLTDARDVERVNNAERAFDVLADNVETITQRNAPSRATEVKLADAGLGIEREEKIRVSVGDEEIDTASGTLIYDPGTGSEVVYGGGAVVRGNQEGNVMPRQPPFVIRDDRMVIQLIELYGVETTAVSGDRTVLVRAEQTGEMHHSNSHVEEPVEISVETEYSHAWSNYLESVGGSCTVGETIVCEFDIEELYLTRTDISVRFN